MCNAMAAGVLGIFGGVLQGMGAVQEHENNAQSYEMAAASTTRDIAAEKESSAFQVAKTRTELAKTQGGIRAGYAANGLALSGSAADVIRDSAAEGELDIKTIEYNSGVKVGGLEYQKAGYLKNAATERGSEGLAFISPIISGAARFGGSFN